MPEIGHETRLLGPGDIALITNTNANPCQLQMLRSTVFELAGPQLSCAKCEGNNITFGEFDFETERERSILDSRRRGSGISSSGDEKK